MWWPAVACSGGVAALYAAWSGRARPKWLANAAGWTLIAVSVALWIGYGGPELGPVYAALALPLIAWLFVLANTKIRAPKETTRPLAAPARPRVAAILRHTALFLVAVPLAAGTGALLSLAFAGLLPISTPDRMAVGVLSTPVAWGMLAYWASADTMLARPAIALAASGAVAGLYLLA